MYIQTPNSPASEFILEEEGGGTLTLRDRFLPYRPIRIEGRQRAEFTWYPGSPEATVQMLGPEEGTIRLSGFWKDRFISYTDPLSGPVTFQGEGVAQKYNNFNLALDSVSQVVQVVDNMRRMGRRITLKWSGLLRVGHIVSFAHTWHNIHDCEWELEFAVLSQGEATVPSVSQISLTLPDIYGTAVQVALEIQQKIIDASLLPDFLALTSLANETLQAALLIAQASVGTAADVARGYANGVISVSQGVRRTVSSFGNTINGLGTQARTLADTATSELTAWGAYGSMDNAPPGAQLAATTRQREAAREMNTARYRYAASRRSAALQAAGDAAQIRTFIPPNDTDLRTISNQFYGTADYWQDLMVYNGLNSAAAPRGQTLNIPPAPAFSDRETTREN